LKKRSKKLFLWLGRWDGLENLTNGVFVTGGRVFLTEFLRMHRLRRDNSQKKFAREFGLFWRRLLVDGRAPPDETRRRRVSGGGGRRRGCFRLRKH
jgi:hypothetical protein